MSGPFEAGFEDVVSIFARKLYKVDGGGHTAGKAQPEFLGALHVKIAHLLGGAVDVPVQVQRPDRSTAHRISASSMGRWKLP